MGTHPAAGRRAEAADQRDPTLRADLEALVEPTTPGRSRVAAALDLQEHAKAGARRCKALGTSGQPQTVVAELLHELGYSLQGNARRARVGQHPDRDAQFRHINRHGAGRPSAAGQPVISVDTKKKELVGDFKNGGREWRPQGNPEQVRVHDFVIRDRRARQGDPVRRLRPAPRTKAGSASASTTTRPAFAVRDHPPLVAAHGRGRLYPTARDARSSPPTLAAATAPASACGSWSSSSFADRTGLTITVCHFPPGTSKWNKIEHRLFSHIAMNWRGSAAGRASASIVNLIAATHATTGLRVRSELDRGRYPAGVTVTDAADGDRPTATGIAFTATGTTPSTRLESTRT